MRRLQNVQGLRAVAAVLVVFVHLGGPGGYIATGMSGQDPFWILHPIGNAGVDVFFAISGLIMIVTTSRSEHGRHGAAQFLLKRVIRIYPPYIVVTLILFAPSLLHPDVAASFPALLKSLALWPMAQLPILFVGWTLTYEMYFYLVFAISILVPARYQVAVLAAWAFTTIAVALTVTSADPVLNLIGGPLNLEFLLGVMVGRAVLADRFPRTVVSGILCAAGIAGVLVTYLVWMGPGEDVQNVWIRILGVGVPAALLLYGAIGLERDGRRLPGRVNRFGDYSYALYLIHPLVLRWSSPVLPHLPANQAVAVLAGIGALLMAVAAAFVFRLLVEQPLLRWSQRLTSGRVATLRTPAAADVAS